LKDPDAVMALKEERNRYAHEVDAYADWPALDGALAVIGTELKHLGIGFAWRRPTAGSRPRSQQD
jgi:hypothetical protein